MQYASVRIMNLPYSADKSYEYHIPAQLEQDVRPGSVVLVPFGGANNVQIAIVESVSEKKQYNKQIKPIISAPDKYMFVKPELLSLCGYMSQMLLCSVGEAAKCVLPTGLGVKRTVFYTVDENKCLTLPEKITDSAAKEIIELIRQKGRVSDSELKSKFGFAASSCMKKLVKHGACIGQDGYVCRINSKTEKYVSLNEDEGIIEALKNGKIHLTPKQSEAYSTIIKEGGNIRVNDLLQMVNAKSTSVLRELSLKRVIKVYEKELDRSAGVITEYDASQYGEFELSPEQNGVYEKLLELYRKDEPQAALLWGVTGSGKTNVILKLIDKVLESGKTVIVLVPEIALTSQTVGRFSARYKKEGIALIHSALSAGERVDAWRRITSGDVRIVIGTRSAVFAPIENLGLIVMDEEHEGAFKSDMSPKYHARDIARFRCAYNNAMLVMASATPSVESFYKAKQGKYTLLELRNRYGKASLPEVSFYDMKDEPYYIMPEDSFDTSDFVSVPENVAQESHSGEYSPAELEGMMADEAETQGSAVPLIIGKQLKKEIADCLDRKEQAILFINRRGYRAFALCRACGHVFNCPNCSVSMTYHKNKRTGHNRMVCHYCGYSDSVPEVCPQCEKKSISFVGSGTQLLEETLAKQFPSAKVLRMDADTTKEKFSHEKILADFRKGNADILVGTQMVAKGHDFPKVSLVGVALADTSLFVNDFRANEKTFSLLTQVLGRAGRGKSSGRAILQTYVPDNDVLNLAAKQDYLSFYEDEIKFRKANVFPPFCDIVTINFSSAVENDLVNAVKVFGKELDTLAKGEYSDVKFILYGPFKNEIYRLAGKCRMRFIIKCRNTQRTRELLSILVRKYMSAFKSVTLSADINPTNL